ncbi:hypothetical protein [Acidocella sp.]|uniref:hypothetical protein n=1 Tax=Acidocella sp. TaxID=50710 RepID=UPI00262ECAB0|nr:hypothetical protein [Acidocella sp.]MDD2795631.1 hypothetical protein [Acidocella sp.]
MPRDDRVAGVMRLNPSMRRGLAQTDIGLTLSDAAGLKFTIVRDTTMVFDVIRCIWTKDAVLAVVVGGRGAPRGTDVLGIIGKEHVADSVAAKNEAQDRKELIRWSVQEIRRLALKLAQWQLPVERIHK